MLVTAISQLDRKYRGLMKYFKGVELKDLEFTSPERLVQCCPRHLQARADIMFAKYFDKCFSSSEADPVFGFDEKEELNSPPPLSIENGCIKFEQLVISVRYKHLKGAYFATDELVDQVRASKIEWNTVTRLDFHHCELFDQDMTFVVDLAARCENCTSVDLSNNRFTDTPCIEPLLQVLTQKSIRWVNITGNSFVFISQRSFFQALSTEQLTKLIFVEPELLRGHGWRYLFRYDQDLSGVEEAHQTFYGESGLPLVRLEETIVEELD